MRSAAPATIVPKYLTGNPQPHSLTILKSKPEPLHTPNLAGEAP